MFGSPTCQVSGQLNDALAVLASLGADVTKKWPWLWLGPASGHRSKPSESWQALVKDPQEPVEGTHHRTGGWQGLAWLREWAVLFGRGTLRAMWAPVAVLGLWLGRAGASVLEDCALHYKVR